VHVDVGLLQSAGTDATPRSAVAGVPRVPGPEVAVSWYSDPPIRASWVRGLEVPQNELAQYPALAVGESAGDLPSPPMLRRARLPEVKPAWVTKLMAESAAY